MMYRFQKLKTPKTPTDSVQYASYDSNKLAKVVVAKNKLLITYLSDHEMPVLDLIYLRPLLVFSLIQKESLNVFDLGGGGGTHFHVVRNFLNRTIKLRWAIVETKSMVEEARVITNNELSFFDNNKDAYLFLQSIDIGLASGVFQYLNDPIHGLIDFMNSGAKFIFISRTALTNNNSELKTIHETRLKDNGPGSLPEGISDSEVSYPVSVVNKGLFIKTLSSQYKILCEIEEDQNVYQIDGHSVNLYGFLCERI
jgi:putative methyltransferase (TIGR04325 family)